MAATEELYPTLCIKEAEAAEREDRTAMEREAEIKPMTTWVDRAEAATAVDFKVGT